MTYSELVAETARRTGLSKTDVVRAIDMVTHLVTTTVKSGERVSLPGFGTFHHQDIDAKPLFGGATMSRVRRKIRFRQSRRIP